jgi:ribosomal protein S18 acetylase RimI-like enzyme
MALSFRTATLSEVKEVARIIGDAFTPYVRALGREWPAEGTPEYAERWKHFVAEIERGDVYVAVEGGRIVGAARTKPQEADLYIDQIAVDPAQQGTGVGSWMLQRIDELARARGLGGLSLITAEMAVANIRLYERHGFEIVRRGVADHGLDPHPRVYMVKTFRVVSS